MSALREYFPQPIVEMVSDRVVHWRHEHDLFEVGAKINPNGTHSSLWKCRVCADIFVGPHVGPIPPGYCPCGWVQKKWPRKRCEECRRPLDTPT